MLKQRVITAIVLASVFAGTILFADYQWVVTLFALMMFAAAYELLLLTLKPGHWTAVIVALLFALVYWVFNESIDVRLSYYQSFTGVFVWVLISGFLLLYRFSGKWPLPVRFIGLILSLSLLWICGQGLAFIHVNFQQGGWIVLYLLTLVWVADIGAYFSGRKFGKHKLAPGISPGKTWEGVAGGMALNVLWILIVFWLSNGWGVEIWQFLLVGLATTAISVVGDLYESILKREAGAKDSGKLLPGHGGVLDRIDSLIAATPVFLSGLYMAGAV
jgi:phosphatidate cytidylyltransferase